MPRSPRPGDPGVKALFPGFVQPALHNHASTTRVLTRRGHDWTERFRKIAADAFLVKADSAIIDGEIVLQAEDGTFDFNLLQRALRSSKPTDRLTMFGFDLLYL